MANRQNTLLIKRSNIIGKIPPISGLTLGELALNTADAKLYTLFTSGTTGATEVRQIGWDRVSKTGDTITGDLIVGGNLTVSGNTSLQGITGSTLDISGNSSSDLVKITQTGSGNAFVVEDSARPDVSPFVITSGGSVTIGTTEPFTTAGSELAQLNVTKGSSGVAFSGLPSSTTAVFQSNTSQSLAMFAPDANNSQIYFGTPSDPFGSYLRWDYTNRNLILATANSTGKLIFQTANAVEAARIDQSGNMGIGLTGATQKLEVSGNTRIYGGLSAQTGVISAATQNVLTIIGSGNSTTSPIFTVQGSSGELFSVSDSLTGSLFSVNDISGLPILEVFSDNTTLMGSYLAPSLNTTTRVIATTGTTNVYSIPTSAYTGAFFDYTVSDGTNLRAGNIMSIWSGTSVNITETQTTDFGNTSGLTFNMVVSSGNAILRTSGTTGNWTVKTIVRSI